MNIIEEKQNPLFDRKEIVFEIESKTTPSHSETEKLISEKFSVQPEVFKIKKIEGSFGSKVFKIKVFIYGSKEEKDKIEFKTKQEKEAEKKALEEKLKAEAEAKKAKEEAEKKEAEEALKEESEKESPEEKKEEKTEEDEKKEENK